MNEQMDCGRNLEFPHDTAPLTVPIKLLSSFVNWAHHWTGKDVTRVATNTSIEGNFSSQFILMLTDLLFSNQVIFSQLFRYTVIWIIDTYII